MRRAYRPEARALRGQHLGGEVGQAQPVAQARAGTLRQARRSGRIKRFLEGACTGEHVADRGRPRPMSPAGTSMSGPM